MENIFSLKVKDAAEKGLELADEIWCCKHPGEPVRKDDSEYLSWVRSTPLFLQATIDAGLGDLDAIFEMPTPDGGYVDVVLAGSDCRQPAGNRLLLVELKQWSSFEPLDDASYAGVHTETGVRERKHPVAQLLDYMESLENCHRGFYHHPETEMAALAFLPALKHPSSIFSGAYHIWKNAGVDVYAKNSEPALRKRLQTYFSGCTSSQEFLQIIDDCGYVMGAAGFEGLKSVIERRENASMVMDQQPIVDEIAYHLKRQHPALIVISGGPGTGKTIIGMHFIYDYANIGVFQKQAF